ncbi:hypothetical protein Taro_022630 [Colocasia esculenta]|uniref:CCHC-type domain-containing protein n=1 Tax=Colocasia esculenta TaxID=4460 RepID=A0A843V8H4_COLES|nr:hypothetical protein [Colocasia esculenta]
MSRGVRRGVSNRPQHPRVPRIQARERDGSIQRGEEGSPEEDSTTFLEARQEVGSGVPAATAFSSSSESAGKCLKCGSTEHQIRDCLRLQQFTQRGAPTPVATAVAAPVARKLGRPWAQARVYALAREDAEQAKNVTEGTLAVESGVKAEESEVPLSVHTPAGETGVPVIEEDVVRSDSEREE